LENGEIKVARKEAKPKIVMIVLRLQKKKRNLAFLALCLEKRSRIPIRHPSLVGLYRDERQHKHFWVLPSRRKHLPPPHHLGWFLELMETRMRGIQYTLRELFIDSVISNWQIHDVLFTNKF